MVDAARLYNLPVMPVDDFNRLSAQSLGEPNALVWTDHNKDGAISPGEMSGGELPTYVSAGDVHSIFTPKFEPHYRRLAEQFRQENVAKELKLTSRRLITTDVDATLRALPKSLKVTSAEVALYKRGIAKLLEVAPHIQQAFERQAGYAHDLKKTTGLTDSDRDLLTRYTTPWCRANTSEFCTALPDFAARQGAVMASGITCDALGKSPTGPNAPFSVVANDNGKPKAIPYATYYAAQLQPSAALLREAADIFAKIPREKVLAQYLVQLADDFSKTDVYPYVASDALWIAHQKSDSIIFARIGPDENSGANDGDSCHNKAAFHFSIGLKNFESTALTAQFKTNLQKWEDSYAALVGDPKIYKAQQVAVLLPDFLDIIYQNGDDTGGPGGTTSGQTLPNWCGADGTAEPCVRRTMIYANKTSQSYNEADLKKYIRPLFHSSQQKYLRPGKDNFKAIVLHELAHNFGPQAGKLKPGTSVTYQATLERGNVNWSGMIEEFKAQMGALYFPTLDLQEKRAAAKNGTLSARELAKVEEAYKYDMVNTISWSQSHILRATRSGKFKSGSPYARLSAATVGYFVEQGALQFDIETKTWKLNFDKFPDAVTRLAQKVVGMYARGDFKEVDDFMTHYLTGSGFALLHSDRLQEVAGKKPSVVYHYAIKGL